MDKREAFLVVLAVKNDLQNLMLLCLTGHNWRKFENILNSKTMQCWAEI